MTDHRRGVPSRVVQWVRNLDGDYYLREEIGDSLGVSVDTLKHWARKHPYLGPTAYAWFGNVKVYLYTAEDLEDLRAYADQHWPQRPDGTRVGKRGRPRLWTPDERREREKKLRRAIYLDRKAEAAWLSGKDDTASMAQAAADELREQLRVDYVERYRSTRE